MMSWLVVLLFGGILAGTCLTWTVSIVRWWHGESIIRCETRQPIPWGLLDIGLTFVCLLVLLSVALQLLSGWLGLRPGAEWSAVPPHRRALLMLAECLVNIGTVAASIMLIKVRTSATWRDLGVVGRKLSADIKLGVTAFVMLAPPVYILQWILVQFSESKHPLIELLKQDPDSMTIGIGVFSAVCVAPIAEEYFFRGLLQGWLEQLNKWTGRDLAWWHGNKRGFASAGADSSLPELPAKVPPSRWADATTLVDTDETEIADNHDHWDDDVRPPVSDERSTVVESAPGCQSSWPIFVSSIIFALLHYSHGPDWVPLFFLALGLGYLYRQTHRIVPGIVVHFLLNGTSMGLFLIDVLG